MLPIRFSERLMRFKWQLLRHYWQSLWTGVRRHGRTRSSETLMPHSDCPKIFNPSTPSFFQLKAASITACSADYNSEFLAEYFSRRLAVTLSWSTRLQLLPSTGIVFLWGLYCGGSQLRTAPLQHPSRDELSAHVTRTLRAHWSKLTRNCGLDRVVYLVLLPASEGLLGSIVIVMSWGGNTGGGQTARAADHGPGYVMDGTVTTGITLIMKR